MAQLSGIGTERGSDPDLAGALDDAVLDHRVEAEHRQRHRDQRERDHQDRSQSIGGHVLGLEAVDRLDVGDRLIGIDRGDAPANRLFQRLGRHLRPHHQLEAAPRMLFARRVCSALRRALERRHPFVCHQADDCEDVVGPPE